MIFILERQRRIQKHQELMLQGYQIESEVLGGTTLWYLTQGGKSSVIEECWNWPYF